MIQRVILAAIPNRSKMAKNMIRKPSISANHGVLQKSLKPLCKSAVLPRSHDVAHNQTSRRQRFRKKALNCGCDYAKKYQGTK